MKSSLRPAALVALVALIAFILTSCPSNRDGMPGQLASAKEEAESACRSGLLALDQWTGGRSSAQLVSVQPPVAAFGASCSMTAEGRSASWMTSNCQALCSVPSPPVRDRAG